PPTVSIASRRYQSMTPRWLVYATCLSSRYRTDMSFSFRGPERSRNWYARCASGDAAYASHQFSAIGYASSSQRERNSTPRSNSATSEAFFEATIPRGFSCRINVTPSGTCTGGFDPSSTTTIGNPRENFWCCSRVFCKTLWRLCVVIATPTRGFSSPTGVYFTPSISTLTMSSPTPIYYFIARETPSCRNKRGVSVCVLDARN